MDNLYQGEKSKLLDSRAIFIIQGPPSEPVYLWTGANIVPPNVEPYSNAALAYIKLLQKHERASSEVQRFNQGAESD